MTRLSISLSESDKTEVSEVRVDGIVDTSTAAELEETIEALLTRERFRIIVDLAGVEYISSAGWGVLISKIKNIRNNQGDIILSGMVPNVREVFELLEFDNVLKHFNSLDAARSALGAPISGQPTKKKQPGISKLEIVENINNNHRTLTLSNSSKQTNDNHGHSSVEELLLYSIENDPFMSIGEMVQHINNLSDTTRVGWWKVFKLLRKNNLLTRRSRFRLARHHLNNSSP